MIPTPTPRPSSPLTDAQRRSVEHTTLLLDRGYPPAHARVAAVALRALLDAHDERGRLLVEARGLLWETRALIKGGARPSPGWRAHFLARIDAALGAGTQALTTTKEGE